jgi:hypothetical protein
MYFSANSKEHFQQHFPPYEVVIKRNGWPNSTAIKVNDLLSWNDVR